MRFEGNGSISRHGMPWSVAVALGVLLFLSFAAGARFGIGSTALALVILSTLGMTMLGRPTRRSSRRNKIKADAEGLTVDGRLVVARHEIRKAQLAPAENVAGDGGRVVYIDAGPLRRSLAIFVDTDEDGRALMDALHMSASLKTAQFKALPPWAKHVRWLAVFLTTSPWILLNFLRFLPGWVLALIGLGYGVIILPTVLPQRVEIGQDGVFLKWLGNRRFIAFSKIDLAIATSLGVVLVLHDGRRVEIRLTQKNEAANADRTALIQKIVEGLELHRGATHAQEEALLARGARDVDTWMRDMHALGGEDVGGYRAISIPRERLWEIVENPSADPSAREGAAIALHGALDDEGRDRLLALAHVTASPRLRIALDGVSQERDEERLRVAVETAEQQDEDFPSAEVPAARAVNVPDG